MLCICYNVLLTKTVISWFIVVYLVCTSINPFPHKTILQQTTLNIFCQIMENLYNWMDNLWLKVENIVTKRRNCTFCAISSFVTMFSKIRLLQRRQKASIWGKGLKPCSFKYHYQLRIKYKHNQSSLVCMREYMKVLVIWIVQVSKPLDTGKLEEYNILMN